jgi:hypothetical protein
VSICIVQVYVIIFQYHSSLTFINILDQIKGNRLRKEQAIRCIPFGTS